MLSISVLFLELAIVLLLENCLCLADFIPVEKLDLAKSVFSESIQHPCVTNCGSTTNCFPTAWDKAAEKSRNVTMGCDIVVYSLAIDDRVQNFHELPDLWPTGSECSVLFLNSASKYLRDHPGKKKGNNWYIVDVERMYGFANNRKASKIPKLFPQSFFASSVKYALYIDAKMKINRPPRDILNEFLIPYATQGNTFLTMVGHPNSNSITKEVNSIAKAQQSDRPTVTHDMKRVVFQAHIYGELNITGAGHMVDTAIMMHDLKSKASLQFSCAWQHQLHIYSDRDQISLQGVLGWFSQGISPEVSQRNHIDERGTLTVDLNVEGEQANVHILSALRYSWIRGTESFSQLSRLGWNK